MNEHLDDTDALLLADLRELHASIDPMPGGLPDRVKVALTVQRLHAELAELTRAPALATRAEPVRADAITFAASSLSLMVTIGESGGGRVLDGWVTVAGARIEVHDVEGTRSTVADEDGRFTVHEVAAGDVWFVVHPPADSGLGAVVTPSVHL